jgi:hypothetical protein
MGWEKYSGFYFKVKSGLAPAAVTTNGNGSAIDRLNYNHMIATVNATLTRDRKSTRLNSSHVVRT